MALSIVLESEKGEMINEVIDKNNTLLFLIAKLDLHESCCLKYIDPYGDTVFNRLQMDDLISELVLLEGFTRNDNEYKLLEKIKKLTTQCKVGAHLYIKIYGD